MEMDSMRNKTMAMALALALSFGAVGVASAQAPQQQPQQREHAQRGWERGHGEQLFKGITLTAEQKAKLRDLRKNEQNNASREQFRKAMADARAARQHGDTAAAKAQMEALRTQMQQRQEQRLATIRSILTPEQQRQFDANVAQWKERVAQRRAEHKDGKDGRAQRGA
jgi:Spy/CpxP family protein refolding chaperone